MANEATSIAQAEGIIKKNITANGQKLITGSLLQEVLLSITSGVKNESTGENNQLKTKVEEALSTAKDAQNRLNTLQINSEQIIDKTIKKIDLNEEVSNYLLTETQKEYIDTQLATKLKEEAMKLYSITTEGNDKVYYTDNTILSTINIPIKVTLSFNSNVRLKSDFVPDGFTEKKYDNGYEYTTTLTEIKNTIPETAFSYTISDSLGGIYKGIQVTKNSAKKMYTLVNPSWYGIVTTEDINLLKYITDSSVRLTSDTNQTVTITNQTGKEGRLVIVTKGSAIATQLGTNILVSPKENISFSSPLNESIMMTGYKVYTSVNTIAPNSSLTNVALNIKLK